MQRTSDKTTRSAFQVGHVGVLRQRLMQVPDISPLTLSLALSEPAMTREAPGREDTDITLTTEPGSLSFPALHPCGGHHRSNSFTPSSHQQPDGRRPDTMTALGAEDGNAKHWREDAKGKPRADNISEQNERGSSAIICYFYSLCLATGLEVISEPREKRLHNIPGNPLSISAPLLHKHLLARPVSRIVPVKAFQCRIGSTSSLGSSRIIACHCLCKPCLGFI